VGDGAVDALGSGFQKIGEADVKLAFAQANSGVKRGEAAEAEMERRHRRPRPQQAIFVLKDGDELRSHQRAD